MAYPENIESIVREFADRLTNAIQRQVATLVAEALGRPPRKHKPHANKGREMTPKPCPHAIEDGTMCGALNKRTRWKFHCDVHTSAFLASKTQ